MFFCLFLSKWSSKTTSRLIIRKLQTLNLNNAFKCCEAAFKTCLTILWQSSTRGSSVTNVRKGSESSNHCHSPFKPQSNHGYLIDWVWLIMKYNTWHYFTTALRMKTDNRLISFFLKHWKNLFFRCFVTIRPQAFKSLSSSILLPQVNATIRSPIQDLVPNGTKVPKWSHKRPNFPCKSQIRLNLPTYMLWDVFRPHALLRVY